jgi:hypothetical protein
MISSEQFYLMLKYALKLASSYVVHGCIKELMEVSTGIDNSGILQRHAQYDNYKDRLCVPMRTLKLTVCICGIAIP